MKILFMGTPDFAVPSLRALYGSGEEIVGVVTQPDKPRGRGYVLTPPPVKTYAAAHGLPVFQPARLRDGSFDDTLRVLEPELIVVVAYGKILPPHILEAPKYGCINVHGSLLPALRGAAPMQRAILNGLDVTGVTTMYMAEGMDTGDMLLRAAVPIREEDNFESVHDRMAEAGAALLLENGLEALYAKQWALTMMARTGVSVMGLELFAKSHFSWGVTSVLLPPGVDGGAVLRRAQEEFGICMAGGQDQYKGRMVRIGHMGWVDWADVAAGLYALNRSLAETGGFSGARDYLEQSLAAYRAALKDGPGVPLPPVCR